VIDVSEKVGTLLSEICELCDNELDYYFVHVPADSKLPCIVYSELSNNDYDYYTRMEVSEIYFSFTIYSIDPELIFDFRKTLDATLYEAGFLKRSVSQLSYMEPCYMQTYHYSVIEHEFYE
jgi:hypothetical protein